MVRARMPYLRGRGCRRGRGVCSSPRGRGRRWQRRRNICNNRSSASKKMQNIGHHLHIRCSFFLMKLGSLALCAFPPGILLSKLLLLLQHHLSLLLVRLRYVLPAQPSPLLLSRIYRSSLSCGPAERIVASFLRASKYYHLMEPPTPLNIKKWLRSLNFGRNSPIFWENRTEPKHTKLQS